MPASGAARGRGASTGLRCGILPRRRQLHSCPPRLRQTDRDRLLGRPRAVLAFTNVVHLFTHELAGLRGRGFSRLLVRAGAPHRFLLRHSLTPSASTRNAGTQIVDVIDAWPVPCSARRHVNPDDPESAQRIVADYAQLLERTLMSDRWPAAIEELPYPKQTIKAAIRTSVYALASAQQLTADLQTFLETAYVSLADFVGADVARFMREYQSAGSALEADRRVTGEKVAGAAWQTVAGSGTLAGGIARSIAEDAAALSAEFRSFAQPAPGR